MNFKRSFLKNVLVTGGFNFVIQLINFLSTIITSRLLLPESFGLVGLITVFSGFITIFSDSGISYAVIRSELGATYHRGLFNLSWIIGLFLCIITLFLIYPISVFYNNKNIIYPGFAIAFLFIVKSLSIVPSALLQKKLQFATLGKATFISTISGIFATIILAYLNFQHWAIILPQFLSGFILYWLLSRRVSLSRNFRLTVLIKSFHETKRLIKSILGFNIVNYWSRNADNLLVGKLYGVYDLGIYNRAYQMLTFPLTFITGLFSSVLYPSLVKLKSAGKDVQKEYYFVLKIISVLNMPIALLLILFAKQFVLILWGENWIRVAALLPYFGLLILTQTLLSTVGSILVLEGREKMLMIGGWISAFFLVSGIATGAFFSIEKIAAFYSLSYIAFVLPYNMIFIYGKVLNHSIAVTFRFWLPKIFISILLWYAIYFSNYFLLSIGVVCWILMILIDISEELKRMVFLITRKKPVL